MSLPKKSLLVGATFLVTPHRWLTARFQKSTEGFSYWFAVLLSFGARAMQCDVLNGMWEAWS